MGEANVKRHATMRNKTVVAQYLRVPAGGEVSLLEDAAVKTVEMLPTVWEISGRCEE